MIQGSRREPGCDKLYKVRPLLNAAVKNFVLLHTNREPINWQEHDRVQGMVNFLQYMPKKPWKWGIKTWVLADAANGFVWNWKLYTGKEDSVPTSNLGLAVGSWWRLAPGTASSWTTSTAVLTFFEICRRGLKHAVPWGPIGEECLKKWRVPDWGKERAILAWTTPYSTWSGEISETFHDDTLIEKWRHTHLASDGIEIEKPSTVEVYNLQR